MSEIDIKLLCQFKIDDIIIIVEQIIEQISLT